MKFKISKNLIILSIVIILIIISFFTGSSDNNIDNNIGIVNIEGPIMESDKIIEKINTLNEREDISGIILRINTPGGAVAPSQEIFEKVKNITLKPIIASVGSMCASGGYYIAIGADAIIANPGSVVGSIGVIINYPIAKELLDKIGLQYSTYKSGELKDAGSPFRLSTEQDKIFFNDIVNDLHHQFIREVSFNRKIAMSEIKKLANGQVFTGEMALEENLIDTLGTFEDALNLMKKITNIEGKINKVYIKDKKESFLDYLSINSYSFIDMINNNSYKIPLFMIGY